MCWSQVAAVSSSVSSYGTVTSIHTSHRRHTFALCPSTAAQHTPATTPDQSAQVRGALAKGYGLVGSPLALTLHKTRPHAGNARTSGPTQHSCRAAAWHSPPHAKRCSLQRGHDATVARRGGVRHRLRTQTHRGMRAARTRVRPPQACGGRSGWWDGRRGSASGPGGRGCRSPTT